MRVIYSEKVKELVDIVAPYMKYVDGVGMVLRDDAPPDVVEAKKELDKQKYDVKGY